MRTFSLMRGREESAWISVSNLEATPSHCSCHVPPRWLFVDVRWCRAASPRYRCWSSLSCPVSSPPSSWSGWRWVLFFIIDRYTNMKLEARRLSMLLGITVQQHSIARSTIALGYCCCSRVCFYSLFCNVRT